jgi:hypothetical protein
MNMGVQAVDGRRLGGSMRRNGHLATIAFAAAVFAAVRPGLATPIFVPYGEALSIDTATGDTYAVQGGSLDLKQNGHVLSLSLSVDDRATVTISGGQVDAGVSVSLGGVDVAGGTIRGYSAAPLGYGAGQALEVLKGSAHITGGTFIGGDSVVGPGGSAIVGYAGTWDDKPYLSTLNIGGGTFVGGTGSGIGGFSLVSFGDTTISGGDFRSPIQINTGLGGTTEFLGSNFVYNDSTYVLSGILKNGDPINVAIHPMGNIKVDVSGSEVRFSAGAAPPIGGPGESVPEPATITIFLLISAGGLARSRRPARGDS